MSALYRITQGYKSLIICETSKDVAQRIAATQFGNDKPVVTEYIGDPKVGMRWGILMRNFKPTVILEWPYMDPEGVKN